MTIYEQRLRDLTLQPRRWVVTGAAGFIGSNIVERLLLAGQQVVGLDNLVTGFRQNLADVEQRVGATAWAGFRFVEADIRNREVCYDVVRGVDFVLHQAALGSVPLSLESPDETHAANVTGFLNLLLAARDQKVRRFVYASSCAVYGDDPGSPKMEDRIGASISPYATSKRMNELYADVFARCYGLNSVGLRYFNIYGRRQDPNGAYAAVIPKWISIMLQGEAVSIHGDGETSRDFCFVQDVVQANVLAALAPLDGFSAGGLICNVGTGVETSLNQLYAAIRDALSAEYPAMNFLKPNYGEFRPGDIRHSRADIGRTQDMLGFAPAFDLQQGLREALAWYAREEAPAAANA